MNRSATAVYYRINKPQWSHAVILIVIWLRESVDAIEQYQTFISSIIGMYSDAIWGFSRVLEEATANHARKKPGTTATMSYIPRNAPVNIPAKMTNEEMQEHQRKNLSNVSTTDELMKRNQVDGRNSCLIAQSTLTTIYHFWDDYFRELIASDLGLSTKNDLKVDALGDIRHLRISIVHHRGIALPDVEKAKVFKWFNEGDSIDLTFDHMLEMKVYLVTNLRADCEASVAR